MASIPSPIGTYAEIGLADGGTQPYTTYYNDKTSTFRTPGWMTQLPFKDLLTDGNEYPIQNDGNWNYADENNSRTISLGNGIVSGTTLAAQAGTSTAEQAAFLNTLADHYRAIESTDMPFNVHGGSSDDANKDTWRHIKNFWYRDGQVFALILDDRANEMTHGNDPSNKQKDVLIESETNFDGDQEYFFKVRPEDHHVEHLRYFCQKMGGTLWAPNSQAEFDDLIERNDGVCHKHFRAIQDGAPMGGDNDKMEIYLNIHREGYLGCPSQETNTFTQKFEVIRNSVTGVGSSEKLPCPHAISMPEWDIPVRNFENSVPTEFFTTDAWFADNLYFDLEDGMIKEPLCDHKYNAFATYSFFEYDDSNSASCHTGTDEPYINEICWKNTEKMRFQKFVANDIDSINLILKPEVDSVDNSVNVLQKDCLVTTCNNEIANGLSIHTGPNNDERHKSEWNIEHCNQHRHVGICRINAVGCSKPEPTCDDSYTRSCGDRSKYVLTGVDNGFLSSEISDAFDNLGVDRNSDIADLYDRTHDVMTYNCDEAVPDSSWLAPISELSSWSDDQLVCHEGAVNVNVYSNWEPEAWPTCTCECHVKNWNDFEADMTHVANTGNSNKEGADDNSIGATWKEECKEHPTRNVKDGKMTTKTWSEDPNSCFVGETNAECAMNDGVNYEAGWRFIFGGRHDKENFCQNNCCCDYNDDINTFATRNLDDGHPAWGYREGDTITVTCDKGYHIRGEAEEVVSKTITVGNPNNLSGQCTVGAIDNNCFEEVICDENRCPCLDKENGYCFDHADNNSGRVKFDRNEQIMCRCDKCYYNMYEENDKPFDVLTCTRDAVKGMVFDQAPMGKCVPVMCANPSDLMDDEGNVIGVPTPHKDGVAKALCGEKLFYNCAEGYEPGQEEAPYALCSDERPTLNKDHVGPNGYFSDIIGTCVQKQITCDPAKLGNQINAWDPVFWDDARLDNRCHDLVNTFDYATSSPMQGLSAYNHGARAVFECYDEFIAVKKYNFLQATADVREDEACADGPKLNSDACRSDETSERFANSLTATTDNDKLVARCFEGEWILPSHKCVCKQERDRIFAIPDYFNFDCRDMPKAESPEAPEPEVSVSPVVENFIKFGNLCLAAIGSPESYKQTTKFEEAACDDSADGQHWVFNADDGSICSLDWNPANSFQLKFFRMCISGAHFDKAGPKRWPLKFAKVKGAITEEMTGLRWAIIDGGVTSHDGAYIIRAVGKKPALFIYKN